MLWLRGVDASSCTRVASPHEKKSCAAALPAATELRRMHDAKEPVKLGFLCSHVVFPPIDALQQGWVPGGCARDGMLMPGVPGLIWII